MVNFAGTAYFLAGNYAQGHDLNAFQTQFSPRKSAFFQRKGQKRVKKLREVTFMKEWMKPMYIGYL